MPALGSWLVQIDDWRRPVDDDGAVPLGAEPDGEDPRDDFVASSVLGGNPAVADREPLIPLDGGLVGVASVSEEAADADEAGEAVEGVLHTESAAGESFGS